MDHSKRKHFSDEVMVNVFERTDQQVQHQKKRDERLEQHADRQAQRLRLATQVEHRVSAQKLALAKPFLEQERQLRKGDRD
ncbi:unnamed protein product [Caretta caretta]